MARVVVLGAGSRGYYAYGKYVKEHPEQFEVVAVAERDPEKRKRFAKEFDLPPNRVFVDWRDLAKLGKVADAVIIATGDDEHVDPAIEFTRLGYHILLEKPIARRIEELRKIWRELKDHDNVILVAHVLRYTPFFKKVKEILGTGALGRIVGIDHREHVGYFHFAHSFVRGNWRRSDETAPSILTKSCHDMDIMFWLVGSRFDRVEAEGDLVYFKPENRPEGAAERCLDCQLKDECPYSATRLYLTDYTGWPVNTISVDLSLEARIEALRKGPYGRCVFSCDNDVCDHYAVSVSFKNGVFGTFTLSAFTNEITRKTTVFGSHGELEGDFEKGRIVLRRFGKSEEVIEVRGEGGHLGGDEGLMRHFHDVLVGKEKPLTTLEDSLESHFAAFAIEESRLKGSKPVDVSSLRFE